MAKEPFTSIKRCSMKFILAGVLTAVMMTGCVYTHVTMPLSTELNNTELGHKRGEATMRSYFWLVAIGDAGAATAAKQGGISVMMHMDREFMSVFYGIYTRTTTLVYGD
jgi:hypothetical protein